MTSPIRGLSDSCLQLRMVPIGNPLHHSTMDTFLTNCLPTHLSSLYHSHTTKGPSPTNHNSIPLSLRYRDISASNSTTSTFICHYNNTAVFHHYHVRHAASSSQGSSRARGRARAKLEQS